MGGRTYRLGFMAERPLIPTDPIDDLGAYRLDQHGRMKPVCTLVSTAETMTAIAPLHGTSQS